MKVDCGTSVVNLSSFQKGVEWGGWATLWQRGLFVGLCPLGGLFFEKIYDVRGWLWNKIPYNQEFYTNGLIY